MIRALLLPVVLLTACFAEDEDVAPDLQAADEVEEIVDPAAPPSHHDTGGCVDVCYGLGTACDYNLFARYDYDGAYTDIEGKAAAGQYFTMEGFSICRDDPGANCVIGRQGLTLTNGQLYGNAHYEYGTATLDSTVNFMNGGALSQARNVNFASSFRYLEDANSHFAGIAANGTTSGGPVFEMTGSDAVLNVFDIDASDLATATFLRIDAPAGSTVLINVWGRSVSMSNFAIQLDGPTSSEVLWNFRYALDIELNAIDFQGSILAPYGDLVFNNGQLNGTAVVRNAEGNGQFNLSLFPGEICDCVP